MKHILAISAIAAAILIVALVLLLPASARSTEESTSNAEIAATSTEPVLTHAQEVWISALEWCESRGKPSAVNAVDRDGTPSYYSFQFKPDTFLYFGIKYGILLPDETTETEAFKNAFASHMMQRSVVEQMVLHYDEIEWTNQFPDCIIRKIGMPPRY